jgi:glucose/arabinose dehydrogenase
MEERQKEMPTGGSGKVKTSRSAWMVCAIILVLLVIIAWLVWQLMECRRDHQALQKQNTQLQQKIDELSKKKTEQSSATAQSPTPPTTCSDTPTQAMKDNIKAALDTKNTAVFTTYTTNPVRYVLAASEHGGDETPTQAATDLAYTHSATGPWDFALSGTTLSHYDAGFYTDYFDSNTYVGRSADGMVVAFDFNCDGKIKQIFVAANEDLL